MAKKRKLEKSEKKAEKKAQKKAEKKVEKDPEIQEDESEPESEEESIQKLLEPFTKEQLIDFLCDASIKDKSILKGIKKIADKDVSHRKVFVHGFGWDTTRELILSVFERYGEIEECNVVIDKVTGKAKGFGFVLFKHRSGASKALKQPQKKIKNRLASCQLASIGPIPTSQNQNQDTGGRKIYVSNVHFDANPEKLKSFFAKFGEIEEGPLGFDRLTGKSRGFAMFVYKTLEGTKKALEEPYKMFEGHQLHCQRAAEGPRSRFGPQDLALLGSAASLNQNAGFNPGYNAMIPNQSAAFGLNQSVFGAASLNPLASSINPSGFSSQTSMSSLGSAGTYTQGFGGYGTQHSFSSLGPSVLGAYGSQATSFQGLPSYQSAQLGQSSARTPTAGSTFGGFQSYM